MYSFGVEAAGGVFKLVEVKTNSFEPSSLTLMIIAIDKLESFFADSSIKISPSTSIPPRYFIAC